MKKQTKIKQFFILLLISVFAFTMLCAAGCGNRKEQSCEGISCNSNCNEKNSLVGFSVPCCGGLFSSGKGWGCDTCGLWSQRIIGFTGAMTTGTDSKGNNKSTFIIGLDNHYYQTEGCNRNEMKSCHALATAGGDNWLIALGKPDGELYLGCIDGSCGFGACSGGPGTLIKFGAELSIFHDNW